jgi:hypothetical protein
VFNRDGHFENLLEVEKDGKKEWKYGPYISAVPGPSALTDFVRLPNQTELRGKGPEQVSGGRTSPDTVSTTDR